MKKYINSKSLLTLSLGVLAVGSILFDSCSKNEDHCGTSTQPQTTALSQAKRDAAIKFYKEMPPIRIQSGKHGFTLPKPNRDGSFDFSAPSPGYNFSTSSNLQVVTDPNTGGSVIVLNTDGANANAGGTVVAGNSSLDISLAFCFSASDSTGGGFLIGGAGDSISSGVSMVIGISGDIEALINNTVDSTADITDYFHGIAIYIVYADEASGQYDVLDWTNQPTDSADFNDKSISMIMDFNQLKGYISSSGTLDVGSNTMSYNGNYFEYSADTANTSSSFNEVSGFGTMGCQ